MGFRATMYGSQKSHYSGVKCRENEEKIGNDYVLRNYHRIRTWYRSFQKTFFSSDEIKICYIFEYQSSENQAFCFIYLFYLLLFFFFLGGGTPGIYMYQGISLKLRLKLYATFSYHSLYFSSFNCQSQIG